MPVEEVLQIIEALFPEVSAIIHPDSKKSLAHSILRFKLGVGHKGSEMGNPPSIERLTESLELLTELTESHIDDGLGISINNSIRLAKTFQAITYLIYNSRANANRISFSYVSCLTVTFTLLLTMSRGSGDIRDSIPEDFQKIGLEATAAATDAVVSEAKRKPATDSDVLQKSFELCALSLATVGDARAAKRLRKQGKFFRGHEMKVATQSRTTPEALLCRYITRVATTSTIRENPALTLSNLETAPRTPDRILPATAARTRTITRRIQRSILSLLGSSTLFGLAALGLLVFVANPLNSGLQGVRNQFKVIDSHFYNLLSFNSALVSIIAAIMITVALSSASKKTNANLQAISNVVQVIARMLVLIISLVSVVGITAALMPRIEDFQLSLDTLRVLLLLACPVTGATMAALVAPLSSKDAQKFLQIQENVRRQRLKDTLSQRGVIASDSHDWPSYVRECARLCLVLTLPLTLTCVSLDPPGRKWLVLVCLGFSVAMNLVLCIGLQIAAHQALRFDSIRDTQVFYTIMVLMICGLAFTAIQYHPPIGFFGLWALGSFVQIWRIPSVFILRSLHRRQPY